MLLSGMGAFPIFDLDESGVQILEVQVDRYWAAVSVRLGSMLWVKHCAGVGPSMQ